MPFYIRVPSLITPVHCIRQTEEPLNELQNARKLEHSNLIKAYSVGEFTFLNTEMLYLVMELAQGSLENHIAKGSLSSSEIKNITAQVAQGLNYLHGQNKVHRDLKPGNILKVNQQYKLADFGLIRTLNNKSHTQTVHNSGTIIYMPPEAFRGDISSAWDLWSLGIMLIEMTTNQLPYKFNNDINQLMAKVMNCELQIPSLPKEFKPIIEGCLQKDRKQRWTAQQVLNPTFRTLVVEIKSCSSPCIVRLLAITKNYEVSHSSQRSPA